MNGLQTARVLVIDDNYNEVETIIKTLGKIGIGSIYLNGEYDEMPKNPLNGIRLLFLDMVLGTPDDTKAVMSKLTGVLRKAITPTSNPLVIVVWTAHNKYLEDFTQLLIREFSHFKPGLVLSLSKEETGCVSKKIADLIEGSSPLNILWSWEQCVSDAATETTNVLSEMTDPAASTNPLEEWNTKMLKILIALCVAYGGKNIKKKNEALSSLFNALNPLHRDRLEHVSHLIKETGSSSIKLFEEIQKANRKHGNNVIKKILTATERGKLNRMIKIAEVTGKVYRAQPGCLYLLTSKEHVDICAGIKRMEVLEDSLNLPKLVKGDKTQRDTIKGERRQIISDCISVLIEVTPTCDYSVRKAKCARGLCGILVKDSSLKKIKTADFLKDLGEFYFIASESDPIAGTYTLVLNCHFVIGLRYSKIKNVVTHFRLRHQPLTDVQHWFASHAARPGILSIS